jgi:hypothetical protein
MDDDERHEKRPRGTLRSSALVFASTFLGISVAGACGAVEPVAPTFDAGDGGTNPPCPPGMACDPFVDGDVTDGRRSEPCSPLTCAKQGIECGPAGDGCGALISDCGQCQPGLHCGGPGRPSRCVAPNVGLCIPKTCAERGVECGPALDGCGGLITSCGTCDGGTQCGGDTASSKCEIPTSDAGCPPKTCEDAGVSCGGPIPDGCGGLVASSSCGACTGNFACKDGACVKVCTPLTCNAAGAQCGYAADGCGGVIDCGVCPDGFSCGHAQPFQCGNVQP